MKLHSSPSCILSLQHLSQLSSISSPLLQIPYSYFSSCYAKPPRIWFKYLSNHTFKNFSEKLLLYLAFWPQGLLFWIFSYLLDCISFYSVSLYCYFRCPSSYIIFIFRTNTLFPKHSNKALHLCLPILDTPKIAVPFTCYLVDVTFCLSLSSYHHNQCWMFNR